MIDLDEMVKRNQGKDFTTPQTTSYAETHHIPTPHTLEEYNAVIAKIAPVETKPAKAPKSRHLPKRGLLLILILAVAVVGSILGLVATGNVPSISVTNTEKLQNTTPQALIGHNGFTLKLHNSGLSSITLVSYTLTYLGATNPVSNGASDTIPQVPVTILSGATINATFIPTITPPPNTAMTVRVTSQAGTTFTFDFTETY